MLLVGKRRRTWY